MLHQEKNAYGSRGGTMLTVRRITRIAWNSVAVISIGMAALVVVLWMRSYTRADFVRVLLTRPQLVQIGNEQQAQAWARMKAEHGWSGRSVAQVAGMATIKGSLYLTSGRESEMVADRDVPSPRIRYGTNGQEFFASDPTPLSSLGWMRQSSSLGFALRRFDMGPDNRTTTLVAPIWAMLIVFCVLPGAILVRGLQTHRRRKQQRCPTCGYDLRASPERCSECGTIADTAQ